MKKFEDLEFKKHPLLLGLHAIMMFKNHYGISVVKFPYNKFEVSVLKGNDKDFVLWYDNDITCGVATDVKKKDITEIMEKVQKLRK